MTLTFHEGFDLSAEFVESAFFAGFLDLGMGSLLEVFQLGSRYAIFTHRVVDGFNRHRAKSDDFAIDDNSDIFALKSLAKKAGKIAA